MMESIEDIYTEETRQIIINFCSYVSICANKKLNLPNIFILLLKDKRYLDCLKTLTDIECTYEVLRLFLDVDPSLHKSKYIKRFFSSPEFNFSSKK